MGLFSGKIGNQGYNLYHIMQIIPIYLAVLLFPRSPQCSKIQNLRALLHVDDGRKRKGSKKGIQLQDGGKANTH